MVLSRERKKTAAMLRNGSRSAARAHMVIAVRRLRFPLPAKRPTAIRSTPIMASENNAVNQIIRLKIYGAAGRVRIGSFGILVA